MIFKYEKQLSHYFRSHFYTNAISMWFIITSKQFARITQVSNSIFDIRINFFDKCSTRTIHGNFNDVETILLEELQNLFHDDVI